MFFTNVESFGVPGVTWLDCWETCELAWGGGLEHAAKRRAGATSTKARRRPTKCTRSIYVLGASRTVEVSGVLVWRQMGNQPPHEEGEPIVGREAWPWK